MLFAHNMNFFAIFDRDVCKYLINPLYVKYDIFLILHATLVLSRVGLK
jgi:hypothetical protein